jgi:hypothetical protein
MANLQISVNNASYALSASYATSCSLAQTILSASYASTASYAMNAGGGSTITTTGIAYVDQSGNDSTAQVGNPAKPFLTVDAAIAAEPSSVFCNPGSWTYDGAWPSSVALKGAGPACTRIQINVPANTNMTVISDYSILISSSATADSGNGPSWAFESCAIAGITFRSYNSNPTNLIFQACVTVDAGPSMYANGSGDGEGAYGANVTFRGCSMPGTAVDVSGGIDPTQSGQNGNILINNSVVGSCVYGLDWNGMPTLGGTLTTNQSAIQYMSMDGVTWNSNNCTYGSYNGTPTGTQNNTYVSSF